ncbi:hypothetical protein PC9H_007982 [Pleurotus ostreatus]|uniref:Protein activator of alkane oxidation PraB n=1 Tax=Pleurotus ostreatus TaxID=5322 RepID=A0A8H7DT95_PLEOS|nr:uncharacterized protein PC9H_007982 [Pleurotus ostreatus]KAF7428750.1 hypothetical protein PC9H_007982 [Pleurotus ostreatus]KAJ8696954.1 hypothetical protein PTI98_006774 [Pleurotus ostreatus]
MKFTSCVVFLFSLLSVSLAQSIMIGFPKPSANITAGSNFTVEVDRPNSLTGSTEVGIAINIQPCAARGECIPPEDLLGFTLYAGSYNPQFHTNVSFGLPPHQNFTVALPSSFAKGTALLSVTHLSLVGAGPFPLFEIRNATVNIV